MRNNIFALGSYFSDYNKPANCVTTHAYVSREVVLSILQDNGVYVIPQPAITNGRKLSKKIPKYIERQIQNYVCNF